MIHKWKFTFVITKVQCKLLSLLCVSEFDVHGTVHR